MNQRDEHLERTFRPIQPSVDNRIKGIFYKEYCPHNALSDLISCYWYFNFSPGCIPLANSRFVADGCIDLVFVMGDNPQIVVFGFSPKYIDIKLDGSATTCIGIRFLPSAFPFVFNFDASEITGKMESLDVILTNHYKQLSLVLEQTQPIEQQINAFDQYLIALLRKKKKSMDQRLLQSIDLIYKSGGALRIEKEIDKGISIRQLRRLFDFYIGDSPKQFAKVVRFQNYIRTKSTDLKLGTELELGYYDQAHFIKEFKEMYGITPSKAF